MKKQAESENTDIFDEYIEKWQKVIDSMAEIFEVPAGLLMRVRPTEIEVLVASNSKDNPYEPYEKANLNTGLYCETVMASKDLLHVPNALKDELWKNNPDVELDMISYLGVPVVCPDGSMFGTICVLDSRTRNYSDKYKKLIWQFKDIIEKDLQIIEMNRRLELNNIKLEQQEKNLKYETGNLETIFQYAPIVMLLVNDEGRIENINEMGLEMTGRGKEDIIGLLGGDVFRCVSSFKKHGCGRTPDCTDCPVRNSVETTFETGNSIYKKEGTLTINTGTDIFSTRVLFVSTMLLEFSGGKKVLLCLEDITENKEYEKALRQSKKNALEAKKAAEAGSLAKSTFLANMSHEIRTPMNAVLGFTDILEDRIKDRELKEYLATIRSSGKSLLNLLNDILDLSKIEAGKFEINHNNLNIRSFLEDIKRMFSGSVSQKNLDFYLDIDPGLPENIYLDETRLHQVLLNLAGNAVKFTDTGHIKLSARASQTGCDSDSINLIISVEDTGIGIHGDYLKSIFNPFEQQGHHITGRYGGTGLGLAISKRLIELMNGTISVTSKKEKGSTFTICLNKIKIAESSKTIKNKDPDINKIKFHNQKILVVDDLNTNRVLLKRYLKDHNLEFIEAENGQQAVNLAVQDLPDLILIDIIMPVMDGRTAAELIKKNNRTKDIPIIAVTASAMKESVEELREICNGYLAKPVNKKDLVLKLTGFLKYSSKSSLNPDTAPHNAETGAEPAFITDPETMKKLPGLLIILKTDFLPRMKILHDMLIIDDAREIAIELMQKGNEYGFEPLIEYAGKLNENAESFNVVGIKKIINGFAGLINKITCLDTENKPL